MRPPFSEDLAEGVTFNKECDITDISYMYSVGII